MGAFSTVEFKCPSCNSPLEAQSKLGECECEWHPSTKVPKRIGLNLIGETLRCDECLEDFTIESDNDEYISLMLYTKY